MRRFSFPLMIACLAVSGCGQHQAAGTIDGGQLTLGRRRGFKVALLTTGPVTDGGWNQSAYEGVQRIAKDMGAQTAKQENLTPAQFREAFRDFASQGYNIIFAHGDEFGPDAAAVAAQFPNVVFITTGGDEKPGPNIAPIHFATEKGHIFKAWKLRWFPKQAKAVRGGQELPPVKIAADAFAQGAQSVNPKYAFKITYINGWSDTVAAKAQTDALLSNGADTIAHNCDAAARACSTRPALMPMSTHSASTLMKTAKRQTFFRASSSTSLRRSTTSRNQSKRARSRARFCRSVSRITMCV